MTVLWVTSSQQFLLPCHWHYVCCLNPLSWGRRDDSQKVLNLVSMEDVVKLSTRMRRLFPLPWCLWGSRASSCRRKAISIVKLGLTHRILDLSFVRVSMWAPNPGIHVLIYIYICVCVCVCVCVWVFVCVCVCVFAQTMQMI